MGPLLKHQNQVSPWRGMPVDDKGSASSITTVTGETVQLYYNSAGTLTADAGQAAGVVVVGQLAYDNIKSILGNMEAIKGDSSLSFTAGALTTEVACDFTQIEYLDETSIFNKMATIGALLSNGQYVVDYTSGTIYGKKTTTATTLAAATYKYKSQSSGSVAFETSGADAGSNTSNRLPTSSRMYGFNGTTWDRLRTAVTTIGSTFTGFLNTLGWTVFYTTPGTRTNGQGGPTLSDAVGNLLATLNTAIRGEDFTYNVLKTQTRATYTSPLTASGLVFTGPGQLLGYTISSCGAGATLKIWDNTSAATTVFMDTTTYTAAEVQGPKPVRFAGDNQLNTGCYFTITGTMSVTPHWNQS